MQRSNELRKTYGSAFEVDDILGRECSLTQYDRVVATFGSKVRNREKSK